MPAVGPDDGSMYRRIACSDGRWAHRSALAVLCGFARSV